MALIFLKDGKSIPPELDISGADSTFEWINGQYWLHSDDPKENPIGPINLSVYEAWAKNVRI